MATREWEISIAESKIDDAMAYVKTFITTTDLIRVGRYNDDSWLGQSAVGPHDYLLGERCFYVSFESYYPFAFTDSIQCL